MFAKPGSRKRGILIAAGGLALLAILALTLRGGGGEHSSGHVEQAVVTASVVTVESVQLPDDASASGTVRPVMEAVLAPKIMSNVTAVYVSEGDSVRRGQVLVRLESRDLQAQVAQARSALSAAQAGSQRAVTAIDLQKAQTSTGIESAKAALAAAREQLSIAREGPRQQERAQARLAVVEAEAQHRNARAERDRMQSLFDQDAISRQRLDATVTAFEVAAARLDSARSQADLVEEGSRKQDIRAAEERVRQAEEALRLAKASSVQDTMSRRNAQVAASQVSQSRAALQFAQTQLGYATLVAPMSGVVTSRLVDPGDTVSPGMPVIAVQDNSLYRLEATVPAADVPNLFVGRAVSVSLDSTGESAEGKISIVSPAGDPGSRTFLVKVDLPGHVKARSGDFGRIRFPVSYSEGVVLPERAVHDRGGLKVVYTIDEHDQARMQVVKTGRKVDGGIQIVSGLKKGSRVIVESRGLLSDGVRVRVRGA